jgi:hypothetical protein
LCVMVITANVAANYWDFGLESKSLRAFWRRAIGVTRGSVGANRLRSRLPQLPSLTLVARSTRSPRLASIFNAGDSSFNHIELTAGDRITEC